jgi:6-phosphogluconolactonase (cycloisomerase 2 family)
VNTPGIFPLAVAVNGTNLYVVDTYQPLPSCSPAAPCSGSVGVFPLLPGTTGSNPTPSGAPGSPVANPGNGANYWPLTLSGKNSSDILLPTGVNVLASGAYLYVTAYDTTANAGYVFGFTIGTGGVLSAVSGSPFSVGVHPSAIASDSTSSYVYVTDSASGNVRGYSVVASGVLSPLSGSPYPAGNQPSAIVVDPKYPFVYVANSLDGNVSAYSIGSSGALTSVGTYATGIQPVAIGIDPGTDHFVFTVNFLGNGANGTVSDFEMSTTAGTLINTQHSPYSSNALPTAVAAVPHNVTP